MMVFKDSLQQAVVFLKDQKKFDKLNVYTVRFKKWMKL